MKKIYKITDEQIQRIHENLKNKPAMTENSDETASSEEKKEDKEEEKEDEKSD